MFRTSPTRYIYNDDDIYIHTPSLPKYITIYCGYGKLLTTNKRKWDELVCSISTHIHYTFFAILKNTSNKIYTYL